MIINLQPFMKLLLTGLILFISACDNSKITTTRSSINQHYVFDIANAHYCLSLDKQCQMDLADDGQLHIYFDTQQIITETPFTAVFHYIGDNNIAHIRGYLEGVDMYMGKIPLLVDRFSGENSDPFKQQLHSTQVFTALLLLGSCSKKNMTWRMHLTIETTNNHVYKKELFIQSNRIF